MVGLVVISCKFEIPESSQPTEYPTFSEIQVSESFDFSNASKTDFTISSEENAIIYIYTSDPAEGGELMYKAMIKDASSINQSINIPVHLDAVWIRAIGENGSYEEAEVELNQGGGQILAFYGGGSNNSGGGSPNLSNDQETCANCDMYLTSSSSSNITINGNSNVNTICIASGESFSGKINLNKPGVEIRVCGQGTFTNNGISMNAANSVLIVNGTIVATRINMNQNTCQSIVNSNGILNITNNFNFQGDVENYGTLTIDGNTALNGNSSTLKNTNTFNISGKMDINSNSIFNNYGTTTLNNTLHLNQGVGNNYGTLNVGKKLILNNSFYNHTGAITTVSENCQINGGGELTNQCSMTIGTDFDVNNYLYNYGHIQITDETTVNGGGVVTLDGGLLETNDIDINGLVLGTATGRVDVAQTTKINGSVAGDITFCDQTGIETLNGSIAGSVTQDCNAAYPTVACDSSDNDGDGVNNGGDDFPDIPDQTFSSYYPAENIFGTLLFEDLFPNKGDYDFNDLVVQYQFETITNASNQVVQLKARFYVQAIGAANANGFGFSLANVSPDQVYSVSGLPFNTASSSSAYINSNGTEGNQNSATFIVFDNVHDFMGLAPGARYNVYDYQTTAGNPGMVELTITFTQALNTIGVAPFNPFIYVGQNRGKEIHLKGYLPTDLVDNSFFNTGDDNSSFGSGATYQTNSFHPWGLDVPIEIQHMEEGLDFVTGYTSFLEYAESNGDNNIDWYTNPSKRNGSVLRPSAQ